MMSTGLKIVSVSTFARQLEEPEGTSPRRHFDSREIAYCEQRADPTEAMAGHWAAKLALADTLPLEDGHRFFFVHHEPTGRPAVEVDPALYEREDLDLPEGTQWDCSITHDAGMAVALAVCVRPAEGD